MALVTLASPLGKLSLPLPLNHWLGLAVSCGRTRAKAFFSAKADKPATAVASIACQAVLPSRSSPPCHSAMPASVAIMAYIRPSWLLRAQMPLSS